MHSGVDRQRRNHFLHNCTVCTSGHILLQSQDAALGFKLVRVAADHPDEALERLILREENAAQIVMAATRLCTLQSFFLAGHASLLV